MRGLYVAILILAWAAVISGCAKMCVSMESIDAVSTLQSMNAGPAWYERIFGDDKK